MSKKIDEFTSSGFAHQNATRPNTVGRTTKQTPGNTKRKMISRKPTKMVPAGKGWEDLHKIAPGISPALPRNADSPENLSKIKDIDPNSVGNYKDTPMPDNSKVKYKSKPRKAKKSFGAMNKYVESNEHSDVDIIKSFAVKARDDGWSVYLSKVDHRVENAYRLEFEMDDVEFDIIGKDDSWELFADGPTLSGDGEMFGSLEDAFNAATSVNEVDVYEAWAQYRDNDKFVPLSESKKKK